MRTLLILVIGIGIGILLGALAGMEEFCMPIEEPGEGTENSNVNINDIEGNWANLRDLSSIAIVAAGVAAFVKLFFLNNLGG